MTALLLSCSLPSIYSSPPMCASSQAPAEGGLDGDRMAQKLQGAATTPGGQQPKVLHVWWGLWRAACTVCFLHGRAPEGGGVGHPRTRGVHASWRVPRGAYMHGVSECITGGRDTRPLLQAR